VAPPSHPKIRMLALTRSAEHPRFRACGCASELHLRGMDVPLRDRRL
jgi:hypothetical protein